MKNRIIVIGLDAADPDLVENWSREGYLPTMTSLMTRGSWGRLASPAEISTGPAWPSFFASVSPARQGRFFYRQLKTGTYRIHKKYANEIEATPFWLQLNQAGKMIAIIDVPKTYPIEGINGVQIIGWGVHSPNWKRSSYPSELIEEVLSRFGTYPVPNCDEFRLKNGSQYENFYKKLISGARQKGLMSEYLLTQEDWDLFLTVFGEPHCAGHHLWHLIDTHHPDYNPEISRGLGDVILDIYSTIDLAISKLVSAAPGATFIIISPHGMGPNYSGVHLLPEVLRRLGMVVMPVRESKSLFTHLNKHIWRWLSKILSKSIEMVPLEMIKMMRQVLPQKIWDNLTCYLLAAGNEWKWSRAFCIPGDFPGAIRVNLKGREPNGLVEPGKEYDAICDELIKELGSLQNPDTGKKAVSEVVRIDKLYQGEHLWELPDLIVKWTGDAPIRALYSPRIGIVIGNNPDKRSGEDRSDGFFIAYGKHIARAKFVKDADIIDIAPTVLYLMGEPIPQDMDGKVLLNIIDEDFKANNPVRYM
ncbi:MAG: alkaline phosphatase family protein [Thermodesulfobacteriota bacterium]